MNALACGSRSELFPGEQTTTPGAGGVVLGGGQPSAGVAGFAGAVVGTAGQPVASGGAFAGSPSFGGQPVTGGQPGLAGDNGAGEPAADAGARSEAGAAGQGPLEEPPLVTWGRRFGSFEVAQRAQGIAVEPSGDFTLAGSIFGYVDFGGGVLSSPNQASAFLAKFDTDAVPLWSHAYAGTGPQYPMGIDVSSDGTLVVSGQFSGGVDFGGGTLQSAGGFDAFLASFSAAGDYRYAKCFGDQYASSGNAVALGSNDSVALVGHFTGSLDAGGGVLSATGSADTFLAGFDEAGDYQWATFGGDDGLQRANAAARSRPDGGLLVAGQFTGALKLGGCSTLTSQGGDDAWLGWFTSSGECLRSVRLGDDASQAAYALASGKSFSNLVGVGGEFRGKLANAGNELEASDAEDAFVGLFQTDQGNFTLNSVWLRRFGGAGGQTVRALAFTAYDDLIVVGDYEGGDAATGLPDAVDGRDVFVARVDSVGKWLGTRRLGGTGDQYGNAVGVDELGNIYVAGYFEGEMVLSTGTLTSAGSEDIFVVKLPP